MNLENLGMSPESLNSVQLPPMLQELTTPSPDLLSKVSSISPEHLMWIMLALFAFRFFGGVLFSLMSLLSMLIGTVVSVFCTFLSVVLQSLGMIANSTIRMGGVAFTSILIQPMKLIGSIGNLFGPRFLVPVMAVAGACFIVFNYDIPGVSVAHKPTLTKSEWVAFDDNSGSSEFERF